MKTFGELKTGDIFYEIIWIGDHISSIESHKINDIVDIKIGRIFHYGDSSIGENFGVTIVFNDYKHQTYTTFQNEELPFIEKEICSNKNKLFEIIENDKENFMNNYKKLLKHI